MTRTLSRRRRTGLLVLPLAVVAATAMGGPLPSVADTGEAPYHTFVSHPDFLNADIGDLALGAPGWQEGDPNSINDGYRAALATVLDEIEAQDPDSVLVAGDLVAGHWGRDVDGTGYFGPVGTVEEKETAIRNAAAVYYPQWLERFDERGLEVHVAVGDHDIGDNPWAGSPENDVKRGAVDVFKSAWADVFTRPPTRRYAEHPRTGPHVDTAYATPLAEEILLVTVDPFTATETGMAKEVSGAQLRWLDRVLADADARGVDWIVVQGHLPVLGPVRYRYSSRLRMAGGATSAFWRTMVEHGVDLYLAGEVHDTTVIQRDGITQVTHGGLFYRGHSSFLTGRFHPDRLELEVHDLDATQVDFTETLWGTTWPRPPATLVYQPGSDVVGTMTLTADDELLGRTGVMTPYQLTVRMKGAANVRTLTNQASWTAVSEPGATFQFQTQRATGSRPFGVRRTLDPQAPARLTRPVRDGTTLCARVRADAPARATSPWSGWRCAAAPYDDRVLNRVRGRLGRGTGRRLYHGTVTALRSVGTTVAGPRVHADADRVRIGGRVGPRAGRLTVRLGGKVLGELRLRRPKSRLAWLTLDPGRREGRIRLRKSGADVVRVDGVEVAHLR